LDHTTTFGEFTLLYISLLRSQVAQVGQTAQNHQS